MAPSPVVQYQSPGQGHPGQIPQSPGMAGMQQQMWPQMGMSPQTPLTSRASREARMYSMEGKYKDL